MADNVTVTNNRNSFDSNLNSDIPTASKEVGGYQYQKIIIYDESGVAIDFAAMFSESAGAFTKATATISSGGDGSDVVVAANSSRKKGSYLIFYGTIGSKAWIEFTNDAVESECNQILANVAYPFDTTEAIKCYQNTGADITVIVYEKTS